MYYSNAVEWMKQQRKDHTILPEANNDLLMRYEKKRSIALQSLDSRTLPPARHFNRRPKDTNQFAQPISTKFLDDRRLCQGAKNLLIRLVALAGRGDVIDTNKTSLAKIMGCSTRTIQRHIKELHIFEYITRKVRFSAKTNFDIGMRVFIGDDARPVFKRSKDLIEQILSTINCRNVKNPLFSGETVLSQIKTHILDNTKIDNDLYKGVDKIPISP